MKLVYRDEKGAPLSNAEVDSNFNISSKYLETIAQTKAESAVDAFVYDTSKDSDGGAWRHRTQHTSWYNEPLNTSTRGSRKEFPAVAVIVAESNKVTIYDGDDPSLPMWMVFNGLNAGTSRTWFGTAYLGEDTTCVSMINGLLCIGVSGFVSKVSGLSTVDFNKEFFVKYGVTEIGVISRPISLRNTDFAVNLDSSFAIVNKNVNDVAMTVLPDAPIDQATGLPIPTIAVATDGGVSVIKDDGTVVDSGSDNVRWVMFGGTDTLYFEFSNSSKYINIKDITNDGWTGYDMAESLVTTPIYAHGTVTSRKNTVIDKNTIAVGVNTSALAGLGIYSKTKNDINYGSLTNLGLDEGYKQAIITSDYNTGWMNGDIKLATLSDTDDTDLVGSELVTNGTFDTDTSGWSISGTGASFAVSNGQLVITRDGTSAVAKQTITTVVGKTYVFSFDLIATTGGARVGFELGGSAGTVSAEYKTHSVTHVATSTSTIVEIQTFNTTNGTLTVDNVSVRLAEPDRSVNNNGLQVFGTVQKNPVATGADLVAYSGFNASNYLVQPYNPDLDFGTGDFCVMGWVKKGTTSKQQTIFQIDEQGLNVGAGSFEVNITPTLGKILCMTYDGSVQSVTSDLSVDNWSHVVAGVKGGLITLYVNGALQGTTSASTLVSSTSTVAAFGIRSNYSSAPATTASLALWRVSGTYPTPEQIKKIYEDEKVLFQENAKATLHGTSDAVTALAYDEDTGLLSVGTSSGRSDFRGLRRVNNTTDAVGVAISASNGLIVEE